MFEQLCNDLADVHPAVLFVTFLFGTLGFLYFFWSLTVSINILVHKVWLYFETIFHIHMILILCPRVVTMLVFDSYVQASSIYNIFPCWLIFSLEGWDTVLGDPILMVSVNLPYYTGVLNTLTSRYIMRELFFTVKELVPQVKDESLRLHPWDIACMM